MDHGTVTRLKPRDQKEEKELLVGDRQYLSQQVQTVRPIFSAFRVVLIEFEK
jgi:hypothetical protein